MYSLESLDRPSARVIGGDDYDDDDTVELELNESAIRALTEAAAVALAAFQARAEPRLTREVNELGARRFEPETPALQRGPIALEHEAAAATQASEAFEQETPAARQVVGALEQETPAPGQVADTIEQETPTGRQGTVSFARPRRKSRIYALGLGLATAVAGLLGGLTYLATARAPHPTPTVADSGSRPPGAPEAPTSALPPAPPAMPAMPATPHAPVRFKNPFDASEVFEFPAGMSRTEVRDAVAELLSQRARERQNLFVKRPRRNTKTADQNASVTASRVTPRS